MVAEEASIHIAEALRAKISRKPHIAGRYLPAKSVGGAGDLVIVLSHEAYALYFSKVMKQVSRMMEHNYLEYWHSILASACIRRNDIMSKIAGEEECCEIERLRTLGNRYVVASESVLYDSCRIPAKIVVGHRRPRHGCPAIPSGHFI